MTNAKSCLSPEGTCLIDHLEVNMTAFGRADYPNSLIEQIRRELPKVFIRVWDNSPFEQKILGADEVRWNRFNPSLSRVWNWAIGQSSSLWTLIANDDISLDPNWLLDLNLDVSNFPLSLWHGPSRFFLFHRSLLGAVGWFDERMNGFTYEDLDYIRRMNAINIHHCYGTRSSLNRNAQSLKKEIVRQCHPHNNSEFMDSKYGQHKSSEDFEVVPNFSTPDFYPGRTR